MSVSMRVCVCVCVCFAGQPCVCLSAMVYQHHEPPGHLANGPHGPAASSVPAQDPHPRCQGKEPGQLPGGTQSSKDSRKLRLVSSVSWFYLSGTMYERNPSQVRRHALCQIQLLPNIHPRSLGG